MKEWYQSSVSEIAERLVTNPEQGLPSALAEERLKSGYNELPEQQHETLLQKFINQFKDFLVLILIAASLISIAIGEVTDSIVILAIVFLNAVLGVFQEFKAEKALDALKKMSAPHAKVIRDGEQLVIPSRELAAGDLILLEAGDYIPADIRIIEAMNLKVEEASLTGESVPVEKSTLQLSGQIPLAERQNMGFMSTIVTYGRGRGIVVETAVNTEIGKIAGMLQSYEEEATPLQRKLEKFGKGLGLLCLAVCAMVFALGIYEAYLDHHLDMQEASLMLMTAVSLAVAAIPEGLPAVVTIVLALGMQRMVKRNAIAKRLHAVETLGSITVICSDKTGTLTQNQMTVTRLFAAGKMFTVSGEGYSPEGRILYNSQPVNPAAETGLEALLTGSSLCNDAQLRKDPETSVWGIIGDPTEAALLVAARKADCHPEKRGDRCLRVQEIPFDSDRKMMTTFHQDSDGRIVAYIKGAPDILLSRSARVISDGGVQPLSERELTAIQAANSEMASQALRVLAVAFREFDQLPPLLTAEAIENELTFIGLLGMIDPPRSEAKEAVKLCAAAGIRPVMITGDHPDTAFAIARELGIAQHSGQVRTGQQLNELSADQLRQTVREANVFARVSPEHKVAIVENLRANGEIVAMTGDGVNDAPALKRADIGVAMGITGTDVTKETADMVVTDDNFASIVAAVEEGRVIYANIRKFVYFLLSCNTAEILVVFCAMLIGWPVPLLPIQLLWVNLVTDAFPALALGMEKKEPDVMNVPPRNPDEPILNQVMKLFIGLQSIVMTITVLGAFYYGMHIADGDLATARTFAFVTLINNQLLCSYCARSEHYSVFKLGLFSNNYLNAGTAFSFVLLIAALYGPLHALFRTIEPTLAHWGVLALLAPLPFLVVEIVKHFYNGSQVSAKPAAAPPARQP
ncbi:MAG: cation-translocating P-type ATPase [Sporomusaceae bacterium]|nr:cation-translocating P-type ATPase [Sporomusaceae bacterium]